MTVGTHRSSFSMLMKPDSLLNFGIACVRLVGSEVDVWSQLLMVVVRYFDWMREFKGGEGWLLNER